MAPNPKQPPRNRRPSPVAVKKQSVELPFDDGEVTPLQADDPRPQRVPQYPAGAAARKAPRKQEEAIPTSVYEIKHDEEFQPSYDNPDMSDPGFKPAFLYVERGPGQGQLVPVRQGMFVIGRASVSELRLQHPSISRRHAQVTRKGEFFYVKDLGSQNGTYVNRQKLDAEVEVHPGDEIAVGNALLKLRGPVQPADSAGMKLVIPKKRRKGTSGAVKVALFAGAVGFGLAAVMMLALLRTQHPSFQELPAAKKPVVANAEPMKAIPAPAEEDAPVVVAADDVSVKIAQAEKKAEAKQAPAEEEQLAPVAVKEEREAPASAVALSKGQPKKLPEPKKVAAVTSVKKTAVKEEPPEEEEAPAKAAPSGARSAILARYEAGNVGAAIEAARKAGDSELLGKLQKFESAYDSAKDAVSAGNPNAAVKNYEAALKLDKTLSSGWGKYGVEIQRELGRIYGLVGNAYLKNGDETNAKKAFNSALNYDPSNATAKSGLAKLGSSDGEEAKPAAKHAAISDAFGDDEEPAPKKKAPAVKAKTEKPADKRSAIDDAFGD